MNAIELKEILEKHRKWLQGDPNGMRADLSETNLSHANLFHADLFRADLSHADLSEANLSEADLSEANLSGTNLSGANLSEADLSEANLSGTNLSEANLSGANLSGANLSEADLSGTNLFKTDMNGASGNIKEIKTIKVDTYPIVYTDKVIQIGCENHTIKEWFEFSDKEILEMDGKKALKFWQKWKPILKMIINESN